MILIAIVAIESEVVVCESEVCTGKETVVLLREPVTELGLNGECSKFDGAAEVVPSRIVDGQSERPVLGKVDFCTDIGNGKPQANCIGLQVYLREFKWSNKGIYAE